MVSGSKQLWCMGNFARFVRPGMKRIAAVCTGTNDGLLVSAYKNSGSKELVTVVVNGSGDEVILRLQTAAPASKNKLDAYTTSATLNMQHSIADARHAVIVPQSVTTFVMKYE